MNDDVEGPSVRAGEVERAGPAVVVKVEDLSIGHAVEARGSGGVPGDGDFGVGGDHRRHITVSVEYLSLPLDVLRAVLAVTLGDDVGEGDLLIRGVVLALRQLLEHDVGDDVLLALLALDHLLACDPRLHDGLREVVAVACGVVQDPAVQGLPGLDGLRGGVGVPSGPPLEVLSVHSPGRAGPGIHRLHQVLVVCRVHAKPGGVECAALGRQLVHLPLHLQPRDALTRRGNGSHGVRHPSRGRVRSRSGCREHSSGKGHRLHLSAHFATRPKDHGGWRAACCTGDVFVLSRIRRQIATLPSPP
eukprot:Hpha_TRINITY_DN14270_c1_g1::TRINITY_DN14270_c1_g1_i1::g.22794::m.22794